MIRHTSRERIVLRVLAVLLLAWILSALVMGCLLVAALADPTGNGIKW